MRWVYFIVFLILVGALGVFAFQNQAPVTIHYLDRNLTAPLALVILAAYVLGMLSGWTVVGIFRRTIQRATERPRESK
jgi:lipopolysaccharide assembly protein A